MENFDYEKLENCRNDYEKLDNELQLYFNRNTENMLMFVFGFSEKEIIDKLENEYKVNINDIVSIGMGGYIRKNDVKKFNEINKYILDSKKEFLNKDYYNCCGLYLDRLWDYESRIGFDGYENSLNDLLNAMGVNSVNDLDKELLKMLVLTEKYYNKKFDEINF